MSGGKCPGGTCPGGFCPVTLKVTSNYTIGKFFNCYFSMIKC